MKIYCDVTEPTVLTTLSFSDEEVISALVAYAENQGYVFTDTRLSVWHPDLQHVREEITTKLAIDCPGTTSGIIGPGPEEEKDEN